MNKKSKNVPISEFSAEDGADDLLSSPEMHPYARLMMKGMVDGNTVESELTEIAAMPLEKRYVWRIASALKWGSPISKASTSLWIGKHSRLRIFGKLPTCSDCARSNSA